MKLTLRESFCRPWDSRDLPTNRNVNVCGPVGRVELSPGEQQPDRFRPRARIREPDWLLFSNESNLGGVTKLQKRGFIDWYANGLRNDGIQCGPIARRCVPFHVSPTTWWRANGKRCCLHCGSHRPCPNQARRGLSVVMSDEPVYDARIRTFSASFGRSEKQPVVRSVSQAFLEGARRKSKTELEKSVDKRRDRAALAQISLGRQKVRAAGSSGVATTHLPWQKENKSSSLSDTHAARQAFEKFSPCFLR